MATLKSTVWTQSLPVQWEGQNWGNEKMIAKRCLCCKLKKWDDEKCHHPSGFENRIAEFFDTIQYTTKMIFLSILVSRQTYGNGPICEHVAISAHLIIIPAVHDHLGHGNVNHAAAKACSNLL